MPDADLWGIGSNPAMPPVQPPTFQEIQEAMRRIAADERDRFLLSLRDVPAVGRVKAGAEDGATVGYADHPSGRMVTIDPKTGQYLVADKGRQRYTFGQITRVLGPVEADGTQLVEVMMSPIGPVVIEDVGRGCDCGPGCAPPATLSVTFSDPLTGEVLDDDPPAPHVVGG